MYRITQASTRSGVSVPLIRAWERRYGIVSPTRTMSGYRMYDDAAIATLVRLRELTEAGWSASEASRAILAGEDVQAPPMGLDRDLRGYPYRDALVSRFVEAAIATDIARISAVLDEIFAQGSYESVVDDLLMPALAALGSAWGEGRLDIAAEHAATAAVHRRLSALYEAAAALGAAPVVVGLPPGSRHELGPLAFAVALRRLGVGVLYLGPDVPVASWVHVMRQSGRRLAVIGVPTDGDQQATLDVLSALRKEHPRIAVALGGVGAHWDGGVAAGANVLPDRISEAASAAARWAR